MKKSNDPYSPAPELARLQPSQLQPSCPIMSAYTSSAEVSDPPFRTILLPDPPFRIILPPDPPDHSYFWLVFWLTISVCCNVLLSGMFLVANDIMKSWKNRANELESCYQRVSGQLDHYHNTLRGLLK